MGDIADALTEQGMDEWQGHLIGQCGQYGPCPYCAKEETRREARRTSRRRSERRKA